MLRGGARAEPPGAKAALLYSLLVLACPQAHAEYDLVHTPDFLGDWGGMRTVLGANRPGT